jgi:hypothetical protein
MAATMGNTTVSTGPNGVNQPNTMIISVSKTGMMLRGSSWRTRKPICVKIGAFGAAGACPGDQALGDAGHQVHDEHGEKHLGQQIGSHRRYAHQQQGEQPGGQVPNPGDPQAFGLLPQQGQDVCMLGQDQSGKPPSKWPRRQTAENPASASRGVRTPSHNPLSCKLFRKTNSFAIFMLSCQTYPRCSLLDRI